ncbi:MAG: hypothetical protein ABIR57_11530 [Aeromicrobium sp.]
MTSGDNSGATENEDRPQRHRRPGPSVIRFPAEPRFWKTVWDNPREPMGVAVAVLIALSFGSNEVASGRTVLHQALGVVTAVAGILLLVSYVLRFRQTALDDDRWSRSRPRRTARALLKYAYGTFEAVVLLALLAWGLTWVLDRF